MAEHIPFQREEVGFLGNFYYHFRWDGSSCPDGIYRTCLQGVWHVPYEMIYRERTYFRKASFVDICRGLSDKHLYQTPAQFYSEFDETVLCLKLDPASIASRILEFIARCRGTRPTNAHELSKHLQGRLLEEYIVGVYIALRQKGYNPLDLRT